MKNNYRIWIYQLELFISFLIIINSCKKDEESNEIIFNPNLTYGTVTDIDGNIYKTISIGSQVWMAENLKTTKYQNGDSIRTTNPATLDLLMEMTPKYQWVFNDDEANIDTYGRLYTWYALIDSRNVCPTGWHVPSSSEWQTLEDNLGGYTKASVKLREIGTIHWLSPNAGATNESGFTALPGGYRLYDGSFLDIGLSGHWWSTTALNETLAFDWILFNYDSDFNGTAYEKRNGYSIRCVKD
jgi:uncharacterized protein (TIGR02145 family)